MSFETVIHKAILDNCIIYRTDKKMFNFDVNGAVCATMVKHKNNKWSGILLPDHPCKREKHISGTKVSVAERCLRFSINKGEF